VTLPARMRFLTPASERAMFDFPPDMARRPTPVNRLDNQALVRFRARMGAVRWLRLLRHRDVRSWPEQRRQRQQGR
jgi:hypothetical protein